MSDISNLQQRLEDLCASFPGTPGVAGRNLTTGEEIAHNDQLIFPTASMIKIMVLFELVRQCARGQAQMWERLTLRKEDKTLGSGLLAEFDEGANLTLKDYALMMMAISDNTATNVLIDRLGRHAINVACQEAGMVNTELRNKIDFDLLAESNESLGVTTPRDYVHFLSALQHEELMPRPQVDQMLAIMRVQKHTGYPMGKYLPGFNPYDEEFGRKPAVAVASKTGGLDGVRCESGLVQTDRAGWALSVCCKDFQSNVSAYDNPGTEFIGRVSLAVWEAWGCPTNSPA